MARGFNEVDPIMESGYQEEMQFRALSIMELLNTEEENQRLALAKAEIKRRRASS